MCVVKIPTPSNILRWMGLDICKVNGYITLQFQSYSRTFQVGECMWVNTVDKYKMKVTLEFVNEL